MNLPTPKKDFLIPEGALAHELVTGDDLWGSVPPTVESIKRVSRGDKLVVSLGDPRVQRWLLDPPNFEY